MTEYNEKPGAYIQTSRIAIEVEPPESVSVAMASLQGYRKPNHIAGTNHEAVKKELEVTRGTTSGVMESQGNIVKRSSHKKG
jgi:hypothetical protein